MGNEVNQRNFPDPRMDPWDYQGRLMGYENGEEFKKEYFNQAKKAVISGTAAGAGVFAGAFGLSAGAIMGGAELPAASGYVVRVICKVKPVIEIVKKIKKSWCELIRLVKGPGSWVWIEAQSTWVSWMGAVATRQGQEVIRNTIECVGNLVDGTPPPSTKVGAECFMAKTAIETAEKIKDFWNDEAKAVQD